ncbi:hypothetical protein KUCAC02_010356 [Chaenocephalus aceratus]|uniref:Uncharacterized protein n=1 Tax=Chaenocephalus aceratus TaxID=36190 RepID=A0ACB9W0C3_CHAAC|nr:hypothetical protein KUCAC02_010356 [Chaenocephalus aceratus]
MQQLGINMPAAVIMEENYDKVLEQCEAQELEAPGGIATPQVYAQLLSLYLLNNDMNNGRYLWKRIPQAIKSANPELNIYLGCWPTHLATGLSRGLHNNRSLPVDREHPSSHGGTSREHAAEGLQSGGSGLHLLGGRRLRCLRGILCGRGSKGRGESGLAGRPRYQDGDAQKARSSPRLIGSK